MGLMLSGLVCLGLGAGLLAVAFLRGVALMNRNECVNADTLQRYRYTQDPDLELLESRGESEGRR